MFGFKKKEQSCNCCKCQATNVINNVKVLGAGCASCHKMWENAKIAISEIGLTIECEYITDIAVVASYGVMSMPALIVNDKVVSSGKVLNVKEIKALIS